MKLSICIFLLILLSGCASKNAVPTVEEITQYEISAKQGDAEAQFKLGQIYYFGDGIEKNRLLGIEWEEKAAEQGHLFAHYILGQWYENEDWEKSIEWFQKGADLGHVKSLQSLGYMYETGIGDKQDLNKALYYYKKANTDWAKEHYVGIIKFQKCAAKNGKTTFFGIYLVCAERDDLKKAVKQAGAIVLEEGYYTWEDSYGSARLMSGTSHLKIQYTADNLFAKAEFTFPSIGDEHQMDKVINSMSYKYGRIPDYTGASDNTYMGDASFVWHLEDGIVVSVNRGWNHGKTFLSYIYPENFNAMLDQQNREKYAR